MIKRQPSKYHFTYRGPVFSFGTLIENVYIADTEADSIAEAIRNISHNWKMKRKRERNFKVELDERFLKAVKIRKDN